CALHLRGKNAGACEARSAEIGLHEPSLIEDCPVEFCIAKVGLVEPRATQNGTRKIEAGEIEARELLAREIGRLKGCCGSHGSLDVRPRHFRRCHLRRRQIDVLHHTLGGCRNGGREAEHSDRTDPDRRASHRLALPRRLRSLNGRCSDDKRAELIIAQGLCARPPPRSRSRDRCRDEGSALEPLDRALNMISSKVHACKVHAWPMQSKENPAMTLLRGARRLGLALAAAAAQLPAGAAELNDYPTAARADYVFACMKANGETRPA